MRLLRQHKVWEACCACTLAKYLRVSSVTVEPRGLLIACLSRLKPVPAMLCSMATAREDSVAVVEASLPAMAAALVLEPVENHGSESE